MVFIKNFLNKLKFRLIKSKVLLIFVLTIFLILILAGPVVFSKFTDVAERASLLRQYPALTKLLPIYWQIRKISDILYLPYFFRRDKLPVYELIIPAKSRKQLDDSLPEGFMNVNYYNQFWAPAKFIYQGREYDVDVRYRGENAIHWNAPKKSYLVEFDKDDLFNGIRRLSFIIADDRLFALEQLNNEHRAEKLGLFHPASWFGNLRINNRNNGLYFIIESWSQEMVAKWELPDESNFYTLEDYNPALVELTDWVIWDNVDSWDKLVGDSQFGYDHYSEVYQLLELLNNGSDEEFYQSIFNIIDEANFYNWQIHQELVHSNHQANNVRLYFDNSAGKFYFIPWDLGNTEPSQDIELYGALAKRIFSNPEYRFAKDKILYDYFSDPVQLEDDLKFYDQTIKNIKVALYKDRMKIYTNHWADNLIAQRRQHVIQAIEKLQDRYKNDLVFAEVIINNDPALLSQGKIILADIDLHVKSRSGLHFKDVDLIFSDNFDLKNYQLYYDSNFNGFLDAGDQTVADFNDVLLYSNVDFSTAEEGGSVELTDHQFFLAGDPDQTRGFTENLEDVDLSFVNALSGDKIKKENDEVKIINKRAFAHFSAINDAGKLQRDYPYFRINQDTKEIFLPAGTYSFTKTTIIPKGYTLRIAPGATLLLGSDVSLVSYSNVIAEGLPGAPIRVARLVGKEPWGAFAILDSSQPSRFKFFYADGGKDAYVNGVFFSGMVSVYHNDITVANSQFTNSLGDDGLNIKSAKAEISDSFFIGNSFDGLDLDFIKEGSVISSQFIGNGNDGIDLSGSTILIADNNISGSGDKCISIGEKSLETVIYNNIFNSCDIGVEIKDLSDVKIINNVIINNRLGLNAYEKKPVFGGGKAEVYNSIIWGNETDIQTDEQSEIVVNNSDLKGSDQNNNFSLEPVFNADFTIKKENANILFINGGNNEILEAVLNINVDPAPVGLNK